MWIGSVTVGTIVIPIAIVSGSYICCFLFHIDCCLKLELSYLNQPTEMHISVHKMVLTDRQDILQPPSQQA